ncbi:MAG: leucine-rich repeat protein, partial [Clostridia bacterium]|nr:leucine-rich repeat protein [Clostridia bacterium]
MKGALKGFLSVLFAVIFVFANAMVFFAAPSTVDLTFTTDDDIGGYRDNSLVGSVTIDIDDANSTVTILDYAFYHCTNLTSVTIKSEGNVMVGEKAFAACLALEEVFFDVKGTVTVLTEAFSCSAMKTINLTGIGHLVIKGDCCFAESGLKEVHIPNNTSFEKFFANYTDEYYGTYSWPTQLFFKCEDLEKATFDHEKLRSYTFIDCINLKKMYVSQNTTKVEDKSFGLKTNGDVVEGLTVYGYTASATEEYCDKYGLKFIPVDSAEFNTITSTQSTDATVGVPSAVTLSVAGFPESLKLESPLCSEVIFSREDAEIVTSETGELWTVDLTPMSEADTYIVTADYGLADLCATDEITIFAEEDTTPPVISVETATPAVMGEYAKVNVTVKNSPEAIRFVDDNVTTIAREDAVITENDDNTETWEVNLLVTGNEQQLTVFAKDETGWLTQGTDFTLKAKVIDYSTEISDFAFEESLDGVIYNGMNTITLTTANGISKVQFMKNGNTWTYTEDTAEVVEVDGKKHWTIKMNFWALGDQTYDI